MLKFIEHKRQKGRNEDSTRVRKQQINDGLEERRNKRTREVTLIITLGKKQGNDKGWEGRRGKKGGTQV